ncbi:MAG TPA: thiamine pyrophosphate-dependent enzyme [Methanospirillum sp.]|nr:thiamine pyrophosphate-dependent enzyme [Methanospirillum sp.]
MTRFQCRICSYIYDEEIGESKTKTPPKTRFEDLVGTWQCPVCKAGKDAFTPLSPEKRSGDLTVSDILIAELAAWGVTEFFGVPGTSSLGIIDAIRKNPGVRFTLFRHEENAAMAASAYNKLTGKLAACVTIAGPGATNLATGLYDAKEDHASVISLNGQVEMQYAGPGGFQEIDQDAFFRPITVYNNTISDPKMAVQILTTALRYAIIRSGVAQISVPNDIQKMELDTPFCTPHGCVPSLKIVPDDDLLLRAAAMLDTADRPVILAGWGSYCYADLVHSFAKAIDAPVLSTFRAKGILPDGHPMYAGILGTVGAPDAYTMVLDSDLLITLGVGFSKMTRVPDTVPILQVDRDPIKLGRGDRSLPIYGDVGEVISRLTSRVRRRGMMTAQSRVRKVMNPWNEVREAESDPKATPIRPPFIMKVLSDLIPEEAIISIDVGENGWWFGRNFRMKKQRFVMSGYLATMGFGLPGAIAAKIASPDKDVVCICGDGGFAMAMSDFVTAVKYKLPMVVVILNNHELGMIRVEQQVEKYPNFATALDNPDFAAYAKACGGEGKRVDYPDDISRAFRWAMQQNCPVILDINTDPERFKEQ